MQALRRVVSGAAAGARRFTVSGAARADDAAANAATKAFLDKFGAFRGAWKHIESDTRQLVDELVTQASDRGAQATAFTLASLRNVLDARHSKKQRKEKNNLTNEQRAVWAQVMALAPIALTEEQRVAVEAKRAAAQRLLVGKQLERERRAVAAELGPTIGSGNGSGSGSGSVGGSGGSGSVELIQSSADVHTCAMLAVQAEAAAARAEAAAALKESARLSELLSIERVAERSGQAQQPSAAAERSGRARQARARQGRAQRSARSGRAQRPSAAATERSDRARQQRQRRRRVRRAACVAPGTYVRATQFVYLRVDNQF
jgi:hypothetical protein